MLRYLLVLLLLPLFVACSSINPWSDDDSEAAIKKKIEEAPSDQELYEEGLNNLDNRYYKTAIEKLQEIERLYPFSKLASKAQVMVAYAHYRDEEYEDSITVIDRFTKLHPGHDDIGYMYYLKAMNYYERIADVARDQDVTLRALESLQEVIRRFPESEYARDAKLKVDLVNDHLAGKQMEIGRFYLKQNKPLAAINRFKNVIEEFQTTSHTPEALYRTVEGYLTLGIPAEAQKYAAVLGHNFPNSKWYKYAYRLVEKGRSSPDPKFAPGWLEGMILDDSVGEGEPEEEELPKDNLLDEWWEKTKGIF